MIPAARIQSAIELVDQWQSGNDGLDRVLSSWGRANRFAGSSDRRAIADLVYDTVRRLRSSAWVAGAGDTAAGRDLVLGNLILDGIGQSEISALFSGARHTPEKLTDDETARLGQPLDTAPRPIRLDFPDWLAPAFDEISDSSLELTRQRAPLFLRWFNQLKT